MHVSVCSFPSVVGEGWKCKSAYQLTRMGMDILTPLWLGSTAMKQPIAEPLSMSNVKQTFPEVREDPAVVMIHAINKCCFFFPTSLPPEYLLNIAITTQPAYGEQLYQSDEIIGEKIWKQQKSTLVNDNQRTVPIAYKFGKVVVGSSLMKVN